MSGRCVCHLSLSSVGPGSWLESDLRHDCDSHGTAQKSMKIKKHVCVSWNTDQAVAGRENFRRWLRAETEAVGRASVSGHERVENVADKE